MKTIGLIGGMSWESSIEYYRIINEAVRDKLGPLHSAQSLMYSVDFAEIEMLQREGRWEEATAIMIAAAKRLERGGADLLLICTNTMHKMAEEVQQAVRIPLLHIADATAAQVCSRGIKRIGLLGTRFTMEEDFYKGRLTSRYGLDVVIPNPVDRALVHRIIYEELVLGQVNAASRSEYLRIVDQLRSNGAEGVILGCTEIGLLVQQQDCAIPLFDTTRIHALAAVELALNE